MEKDTAAWTEILDATRGVMRVAADEDGTPLDTFNQLAPEENRPLAEKGPWYKTTAEEWEALSYQTRQEIFALNNICLRVSKSRYRSWNQTFQEALAEEVGRLDANREVQGMLSSMAHLAFNDKLF